MPVFSFLKVRNNIMIGYNKENLQKFIETHYKTPTEQFSVLFETLSEISIKNGYGDPFSYARGREIHMAGILGHIVASTYSGADAYDSFGQYEYKSTIGKNITATYNGISLQSTWEEQVNYLKTNKICKYKTHYFSRYDNGQIKEIWSMDGETVYELLVDNLKKQYYNVKNKKDPRLGAIISEKKIKKYGKKVY